MTRLRLAVQEHMVPGSSLIAKFELVSTLGYEAIELRGRGEFAFRDRLDELRKAQRAGVVMPTVCPEMDHFIGDFDAERRRDAIANLKSQISVIVQVGGFAAITPASWGMFSLRLPPFVPPRSPAQDREVLIEALGELGEHAVREGGKLLLEPINRYENHMVHTLAQAVELCDAVGLPSLGVVADAYHMNIEEEDLPAALRAARQRLMLVHACDSGRQQVGTGHLDWPALLAALREIGYDGYLTAEGTWRGDPESAMRNAADHLRRSWAGVMGGARA
jgi:sugar phosphate isomerase/epimerase